MNFVVIPSLQQIALQKVVIALWSGNVVRKLMTKGSVLKYSHDRMMVFTECMNIVRKEIVDLPLPEQLKKKLVNFVKPIGLQLLVWIDYHSHWYDFVKTLPTTFHFTTQGAVDNKAMAEMLVQDPSINVINRFKLACTYSLIPHVHTLWEQLPDETYKDLKQVIDKESHLVSFWVCCLAGKANLLNITMHNFYSIDNNSLSEHAFLAATASGNLASTRYFLKKLTHEEKERTLPLSALYIIKWHHVAYREVAIIRKNYYTNVLYFLLSEMNEQQQLQLFNDFSSQVLIFFLDWPWNHHFLELFERVRHFLRHADYHILLHEINTEVLKGSTDQNYQNLFATVWTHIPRNRVDHVYDICTHNISPLMHVALKEHISLILKGRSGKAREEILLGEGKNICKNLVCDKLWDLFRWFVQTCVVSKKTLITFRDEFKTFFLQYSLIKDKDDISKKSSQICDELIQGFGKRKISEDDQSMSVEEIKFKF